jgi:hypothetical protein
MWVAAALRYPRKTTDVQYLKPSREKNCAFWGSEKGREEENKARLSRRS